MQPIHIETLKASSAAVEVCNILRKGSASWLVWSANDEGYLMVPASSAVARSVRRYYPETIAGEFMTESSPDVVSASLVRARRRAAEVGPANSFERRAYLAEYKRKRRAIARKAA